MRSSRFFLAPAAALLLGAQAPSPLVDSAAANRMHGHVAFLASDRLEGRATGSAGYALAADYVADQFKAFGLKPGAGGGTWFQQVRFRSALNTSPPVVTYTDGRRALWLTPGRDVAVVPSLVERQRTFRAGLVFVGHGISEPALGIDEYAGLDVRGKIVVALDGVVRGLPGDIAAHLEVVKERTAVAKGAIGFIKVAQVSREDARRPVFHTLDETGTKVPSSAGLALEMTISTSAGERLFKGAPKSLSSLRSAPGRDRAIAGFHLPGELTVQSRSTWQEFNSPQVIGLIPGADPILRDEYVVVMAHLDHLGKEPGAKRGEDGIFNGALDNAAGVATLLEVAAAFGTSAVQPRRSVMLVATVGEERGLLGAYHLARSPPVPADRIVAAVNLDMPLLTYDFTDVIAFGADHSTIVDTVAAAGRSLGVEVSVDPMPEQNLFIRSDHYPFVLRGIPSIFLMTGYANGGRQAWSNYLGRVYHRPNDDLKQPIRWAAAARFAALNHTIARTLADQPQRPQWRAGDYFGRRQPSAPGRPR